MATSLQISVLLAILVLSLANSTGIVESTATAPSALSPSPPPPQTPFLTDPPQLPRQPAAISHDEIHDQSFFSYTSLLGPILSHLGFSELATAASSLSSSSSSSSSTTWSGPSTLFAPSDSSLRACVSCSVPDLLREHIVPGLFSVDYLRKLAFGTKIETLSPGRCVTVTSSASSKNSTPSSSSDAKVFIGGAEITHPDLFNQGLFIIHGIQGFIAPLSPFSCDVERLNSLTFPTYQSERLPHHFQLPPPAQAQPAFGVMRLMLRDAILKLRNNGFNILSLALRVKYGELVSLSNMTVFAVDDVSIFSGTFSYISSVRFHIVPNHFLMSDELETLPVGATLPTLERGQSLVITSSGVGGLAAAPMRINYVRLKVPEVMRNMKIVVHSVYLPFPRIHPTAAAAATAAAGDNGYDGMFAGGSDGADREAVEEACSASAVMEEDGSCNVVATPQVKPTVEIEDHHGL